LLIRDTLFYCWLRWIPFTF